MTSRRTILDPDAALAIIDSVRDESARIVDECRSRIQQRIAELPAGADRKDEFRIRCEEADRARAELQRIHDDSLVAIRAVMFPLQ